MQNVRQRQPHRAQLREARLVRIEDAARDVQMGDRIAIVEHRAVSPAPHDCRYRGCRAEGQHRQRFPARNRTGLSVKVRQLAEKDEAVVDLLAGELLQPLGAKALARKRAHHAAVKHGAPKGGRRELGLRGQIAEEPAGKAVARAGRVDHFFQRQRRRTEDVLRIFAFL